MEAGDGADGRGEWGRLAARIRELRAAQGLSLADVAARAGISKTYLWSLEKDTAGVRGPSGPVLIRLAEALSVSLTELLDLAAVEAAAGPVELTPSLREFRDRMGGRLSEGELRELAAVRFRGDQPRTADDWHHLYFVLVNAVERHRE